MQKRGLGSRPPLLLLLHPDANLRFFETLGFLNQKLVEGLLEWGQVGGGGLFDLRGGG